MIKKITLFLMIFVLSSCECMYVYDYIIKNDTKDEIYVTIENATQSSVDSTYTISPSTSLSVIINGSWCKPSYKPEDIRYIEKENRYDNDMLLIDYITSIKSSEYEIDELYWSKENWNFKSEKGQGIYSLTIKSNYKK